MKKLIVDLDSTITMGDTSDYENVSPRDGIIKQLKNYREQGFEITIFTARNMRTFEGNIGKINIHTLPIITKWLEKHNVAYDEIIVGKPWCGHEGFYIDDRAIRPQEFAELSLEEINTLIERGKQCS